MDTQPIEELIHGITSQAHQASRQLAQTETAEKNRFLAILADQLDEARTDLKAANAKDLEAGRLAELSTAMLDRLALNDRRIDGMIEGVREVAALPDPVGEEMESSTRPNGLLLRKIRVPLGVVGIIYESRPNVTIDCAVLCLKSGNAAILRGGKEAIHTNRALAKVLSDSLAQTTLPPASLQLIPTTDRYALTVLLRRDEHVQCIIPRGGESLIRFVVENSTIPVIKHYQGVCHAYVDAEADLDMATEIVFNAKCQRPGVCNAIEKLILHESIAPRLIPGLFSRLSGAGVELRLDETTTRMARENGFSEGKAAEESDWTAEYLDLILTVKTVSSVTEAIDHINTFGSGHSETIITGNEKTARQFQRAVDAAAVYWNASTRFTDGFEFGLGAEIGISTDKLHARGPMGLRELCSYKFVIDGQGTIRT